VQDFHPPVAGHNITRDEARHASGLPR
jgi:hypothetical protein